MIEKYTFSSEKGGPKILIFGAIHGNEPCGTKAIGNIISRFQNSEFLLKKGSVTFVPIANPLAYEKQLRYAQKNLNRIFGKYSSPKCEEEAFSDELAHLIDEHDYLLDIHSTTEPTLPYVFQDFSDSESELIAKSIPSSYIVSGWQDLYEDTLVGDTISYAYSVGKKAILLECGQHQDNNSQQVACDAIISFLYYFGVVYNNINKIQKNTGKYIRMQHVFYKKNTGEFIQNWENFDMVKKGEALAKYYNGTTIYAPENGYIIMPNDGVKVGEDWFYFGIES